METQTTSTISPQKTKQNVFKLGYSSILVDNDDEFTNGYFEGYIDYPKDEQPLTVQAIRTMLVEALCDTTATANWNTGYVVGAIRGILAGTPSQDRDPEIPSVELGSVTLRLNRWRFSNGYYAGRRLHQTIQADQPSRRTVTATELLRSVAHYDPETRQYSFTEDQFPYLEAYLGQLVGYVCEALFPKPAQEHDTKRGKKSHPNKLKTVVKAAGLTISELSKETNIPRGTLYFWSACKGIIPQWARLKIAQVIGCQPQDLAIQEHDTESLPVIVLQEV